MKRRLSLHVLLAAVLCIALVGAPSGRSGNLAEARDRASTSTPLVDRLSKRIAASGVRSGKLGVCVLSLDTGAPLMERDALLPLIPASVAKIATTAAALDLLGPGYVYETSLDARGTVDPRTGTLVGDLVLHGSGDPGLSRRAHEDDPLWPLSVFAKAARDAGIRRVTGALVLDDGPFDREFLHASWAASDLDDWYGAPVAGLSFNDACVTVRVRGAASDGDAATVTAPSTSGPWPLECAVRTWGERRTEVGGLWADERHRLKVSGALPPRQEYEFETPVPDPLQFIGAALVQTLATAGVQVDGGARLARTPEDRAAGQTLAVVKNPLAPTLKVMNKKSQNLYAELVFKACGAERFGLGSWTSGERAVLGALASRGLPIAGLRVVDGSGLSKENRLSAACLAGLLLRFDADPLRGPVLRDSLAVPGEDGTLEKRFREPAARTRVRAKTGTLGRTGVHALVGFVDGTGGARGYAFAILVNDGKVDAKDLMDDLVRELLEG